MVPRSLNPTDVLGAALRIYREQAGVLIGAALVVFALDALATAALQGEVAFLATAVALIAGTFYQGMVVELVRDVQDGRRDSSVRDLFAAVSPVFGALLLVSLLLAAGVTLGLLALIVPGLILLTLWAVVAPVTVIEQPGVLAAFGRSRALVRGHGWPVFGVIALVFLLIITVAVVASLAAAQAGEAVRVAVQFGLTVLTAPLGALATAVLYFALRRAHGELAEDEPERAGGSWS